VELGLVDFGFCLVDVLLRFLLCLVGKLAGAAGKFVTVFGNLISVLVKLYLGFTAYGTAFVGVEVVTEGDTGEETLC